MLRVLFAVLILSVPASAHAQMFGLGESQTRVVSERTFGLSSFRLMRAEPVKAQPEPLPQLSSARITPVARPVLAPVSAPMICENGVCRPAAASRPAVISRPRLFRRR
jgi:hypothetical protein